VTKKFDVQFLEGAVHFLESLEERAREKVLYNIRKAQVTNDKSLFKKLNSDIWEFRTFYNQTHFRLFAFWTRAGKNKTLVIATHGLIKKTAKTPKGDLEKAENLRRTYLGQQK
jgi:phage-related protein